jgi:hypothetical protein
MDIGLLMIGAVLATILLAFAAGVIPYPYGWLVLTAFLVGRWLQLRRSGRGKRRR